jgi:hypothetical protein
MEKRVVHIDGKKEVKPPKKQKRKPTVKKVFYKKREKREWFERFNSMNDYI